MKKPLLLAQRSIALALFICLFFFSCKKSNESFLETPTFQLEVVATSPKDKSVENRFDEQITATLNGVPDTAKYELIFEVRKGDSVVNGSTKLLDSLVVFIPETELLPSTAYSANLSFSEKGKTSPPVYSYQWSFITKPADEYKMTFRSAKVTDFVRDGSRAMQIGEYLYSFGGWNVPERSYNDVYRSKGNLENWEKLPDAPWHGRHVYGIGKIGDATYIIGGDNLQPVFDVWKTTDGENWTVLTQNILDNRIFYGCTVHNGYIYVVGGVGHYDVWRSHNGIDWERVADYVACLRGENLAGSVISFNGRLWKIAGGGTGYGDGVARRDVWSSADGKVWRQEKDFQGTGRQYTDMCVWDNKLWVVGGHNQIEGNIKSIWYMKPDGNWKEFETPAEYLGRHATAVAVYNNQLIITCGNYYNDCWAIEKIR